MIVSSSGACTLRIRSNSASTSVRLTPFCGSEVKTWSVWRAQRTKSPEMPV